MSVPKQDAKADLLPCPFCGGEPRTHTYVTESLWSHDQVTYTKVYCDECDLGFDREPGHEPQAVAAWNRRASPKGCDVELRAPTEDQIFSWLNDKYVQRSDPRQRAMNLQYMEAETHDLSMSLHKWLLALINQARQPEGGDDVPTWVSGAPVGFRAKEWFIAETTYGDRVVLTALPEEYTYDFKTADQTYIRADRIKRWMPFPDSEFSFPTDNADGLSDDRAVAWRYEAELPGRDRSKVWRVCQSADEVENLRDAGIALQPLFTRPPAGKDLAGEGERLRAVADFLLERDEAIQGDAQDAGERTESARQILSLISGSKR